MGSIIVMATLSTYINFPGNAGEVFNYWHDVFGGTLHLLTYRDAPPMSFDPDPNAVAHAELSLPGGVISGGDAMVDTGCPIRDTVYSFLYTLDDIPIAEAFIARLIEDGGSINMPFSKVPWGAHYGQVFDKFGFMWSFNVMPRG